MILVSPVRLGQVGPCMGWCMGAWGGDVVGFFKRINSSLHWIYTPLCEKGIKENQKIPIETTLIANSSVKKNVIFQIC